MTTRKYKNTPLNQSTAVGDTMADGTIFAGISPDTGKPMYTTPVDAPLTYTFNEAQRYAERLRALGHKDWRVPTKAELNVLWENRAKGALKETFNVSGSYPDGWYWSSAEDRSEDDSNYDAWTQSFSDGSETLNNKNFHSSLRCIR
jgi:hypothetical protein